MLPLLYLCATPLSIHGVPLQTEKSAPTEQRPEDSRLQAAAVICWDWTEANRVSSECQSHDGDSSAWSLIWGLRRAASGLSHLT